MLPLLPLSTCFGKPASHIDGGNIPRCGQTFQIKLRLHGNITTFDFMGQGKKKKSINRIQERIASFWKFIFLIYTFLVGD
jgi:hypothetical protein